MRVILFFLVSTASFLKAADDTGTINAPVVYYRVDGEQNAEFAPSVKLPSQSSSIVFQIQDTLAQPAKAVRTRYRMEGVDPDWIQKPSDMAFNVTFYNATGDQIHQDTFKVVGTSPGWRNSVERSTFTSRSAALTAPHDAASVGFGMSSAGPPAGIGVFIVKNIQVTRIPSPARIPEIILEGSPSLGPEAGMADPRRQWMPDGASPTMAKIIEFNENGKKACALEIVDTDIKGHAEWRTPRDKRHAVAPGDKVVVEWEELFDIGIGDENYVAYANLPAGHHRFDVESLDIYGVPQGAITSFDVQVPVSYWENPYFWLFAVAGLTGIIVVGNRYIIRSKLKRHLQRVQLVDQERQRIARDLHDDLGSRLTQISLLSAHARRNKDAEAVDANFNEISHLTRDLVTTLSETVWMLNSKNDNLEALINFLCQLIPAQCKPAGIRCRIDAPAVKDDHPISSAIRHNITLSVKEILNNAVRHSQATEIHAQMRYEESVLKIAISDNGRGFEENTPAGNGLDNITRRIAAIGGKIDIQSHANQGTRIAFEILIA